MKVALRRIAPGSGWGNVGEGIERELRAFGIDVVPHDRPAPVVLHVLPPHFYDGHHKGAVPWLYNMWETNSMPEGLLQGLGNFEGIIVPTEENLAIFREHHPNVHKVNVGVDWQFYTPVTRTLDGPFRFLYTAHSPHRKGGDVAEKAGRILRDRGYDIGLVPAVAPTDEALRDLYWSCHAYLQPSRGEGWGMMPHQALATGMPVVISDCLGHRDYAWLPGCYLTATHEVDAELDFHGPAGRWWEPDVEDVVEQMAWVVDHYADAHALAQQAPALCAVHFDWTQLTGQIIDLIGLDTFDQPDPPADWQMPRWKEYPVVALRRVDCDIAQVHYNLSAGQEIGLPWDARRVLVHSGAVEAL